MPGRDGTGPMGQGPMTGGGRGWCGGGAGRGRGMGRGMGAGWGGGGGRGGAGAGRGWRHRNMFHATGLTGWQRAGAGAPDAELAALRLQAEQLGQALDEVRARIQALDTSGKDQG